MTRTYYSSAINTGLKLMHDTATARQGADSTRDCLAIDHEPGRSTFTHHASGTRLVAVTQSGFDQTGPFLTTNLAVYTSHGQAGWWEVACETVEARVI